MRRYIIMAGVVVSVLVAVQAGVCDDCETECTPAQSCSNLLECRVAEIDCQQSCRQRYALEGLAEALEKITVSMNSTSISTLNETDILTQPETTSGSEEPYFPALGEHRKKKTTPFLQIDRGATVIITNSTSE